MVLRSKLKRNIHNYLFYFHIGFQDYYTEHNYLFRIQT